MAKKRVFVSFDYENDKRYYYIMRAWDANSDFEFCFSDYTSREIQSDNVDVVKRALSRKIGEATYTLVIIGKEANKRHKDAALIGYRNWQNFEVAKSVERGNRLIGVKIESDYESPEELYNKGAAWASSFTVSGIIDALNVAAK